MTTLPQYMKRPDLSGRTYGTLRQVAAPDGRTVWEIEGDPQVVQLAKRLFPGSDGKIKGRARFPAGRRMFGDLVWLLHRWPLRLEDREAWDDAYVEACRHHAARTAAAEATLAAAPISSPRFQGTLAPFQTEGVAWLSANLRTLLADEMGHRSTTAAARSGTS